MMKTIKSLGICCLVCFLDPPSFAGPLQWHKVPALNRDDVLLPHYYPADAVGKAKYPALELKITQAAQKFKLDPFLVQSVVAVESGFRHDVTSAKGAVGLMQIKPDTASRYGRYTLTDPVDNLEAGSAYLSELLQLFNGRIDLALAGYNAGEHAVIRYGMNIPPYPETRNYVRNVLSYYQFLLAREENKTKQKTAENPDSEIYSVSVKYGSLTELWTLLAE